MDKNTCTPDFTVLMAPDADLRYEKVWVIFFLDTINTIFTAIFVYDGVIKHFGG